jgi:hypothetical protein
MAPVILTIKMEINMVVLSAAKIIKDPAGSMKSK